jgi:hypothetical protein
MADELSLIVADDAASMSQVPESEVRGGEIEVRGERWNMLAARFSPKRRDIVLQDVQDELDRVQNQIGALLARIQGQDTDRFRLSEVEVSLAISAEGSIGVATAGVEASIALTFARKE